VLDCATFEPGRDPLSDLDVIERELSAHGGLEDRPRLVVLNKIDIPDARELAEMVTPELEARGLRVFSVSTKNGEGLQGLIFAMAELVAARRADTPPPQPARIVLRPRPVGGKDEFQVTQEGEMWRVRGEKPERWVRQTDFNNAEAVGYLADRLNRIGIEDRLLAMGARAGDGVAIGGEDAVVFDFSPQLDAGAEILSRRGEDQRFETKRPAAQRRRAKDLEYHLGRDQEDDDEPLARYADESADVVTVRGDDD
jgi:GTP-binding protein